MGRDAPVGWIREVVMNSPEPWELALFWSRLLGGTPVEWYAGWVTLEPPPHGQRLSFQRSTDPHGSSCPVHFDVLVEDLDRAHEQVLDSGGTFVREQVSPRPAATGQPVPWRVYEDPDGHPFCLVLR